MLLYLYKITLLNLHLSRSVRSSRGTNMHTVDEYIDLDKAHVLAGALQAIGYDTKQPIVVQDEALLLGATVRGSISAVIRSNGGGAQGKIARKDILYVYQTKGHQLFAKHRLLMVR